MLAPAILGLLGVALSPQLRSQLVVRTDARRPMMSGAAPPGSDGAPLTVSSLTDSAETAPFEAQLAALLAWRDEIGHADVPLGSSLGRWVYTQRRTWFARESRIPQMH